MCFKVPRMPRSRTTYDIGCKRDTQAGRFVEGEMISLRESCKRVNIHGNGSRRKERVRKRSASDVPVFPPTCTLHLPVLTIADQIDESKHPPNTRVAVPPLHREASASLTCPTHTPAGNRMKVRIWQLRSGVAQRPSLSRESRHCLPVDNQLSTLRVVFRGRAQLSSSWHS